MAVVKNISIIFMALIVVGCDTVYGNHGYLKNRNKTYLQAANGPVLKAPRPLSDAKLSNKYVVDPAHHVTPVSLLPPGSLVAQMTVDKTKLNKTKKANHGKS